MKTGIGSVRRMLLFVIFTIFLEFAVAENDEDFKMCGTWLHRNGTPQTLAFDLRTGCDAILISANDSTLSIRGSITAQEARSRSVTLNHTGTSSRFCVLWEPLLDMLKVQVNGKDFTLYGPFSVREQCCTDLSLGAQKNSQQYGIANGSVRGDTINEQTMEFYEFKGGQINCKEAFCSKASSKSGGADMIEDAVMRSKVVGKVDMLCAQSNVVEMNQDFAGRSVSLAPLVSAPLNTPPTLYLPACLKPPKAKTAKVVCTYYNKSALFQKSSDAILDDVVGISVENEKVRNLPEPVRIKFQHSAILTNQTRKCVSWDTREDNEVTWKTDGCTTVVFSATETECCCNHLTYFAILVEVNQNRTLRHVEALTYITAVGCAISIVSCIVLFVSLCRKRRRKETSSLLHRGLVVALFLLCVLFVLTGTVGNIRNDRACRVLGAMLHYALLSTLCWMAVEVFHTFWMVQVVFNPLPKPWIWYMLGFGFPLLPVVILACVGDIYGQRIITAANGDVFRMCWMTESQSASLAHFIINISFLAAIVSSGAVMLVVVVRTISNRAEWKNNRLSIISIWGLSCLFGTSWTLAFFDFGVFSEAAVFLFCVFNSLQGFFLMLRFYGLECLQRKTLTSMDGSSTGSTRQHILLAKEQS